VTAAERQVQLAHPPVQMRAHEPPSQPTETWAGGGEIDFVVNLELLTALLNLPRPLMVGAFSSPTCK